MLTVDNTLYCGIARDVEKRFMEHISGKGAKYTRSHKPLKIVYTKEFENKSEALREEIRIKKLSKKEKQRLIDNQ